MIKKLKLNEVNLQSKVLVDVGSSTDDNISANDIKLAFSNDFEIKNGKISLYKGISIVNYNLIEPSSTQRANGNLLNLVKISYNLSKEPTDIKINNIAIKFDSSKTSDTIPFGIASQSTGTKNITILVSDGVTTASKTITITFMNYLFYGVSNITNIDDIINSETNNIKSNFIDNLTSTLNTSYVSSFNVNAGEGEYIYYITSFGSTLKFSVGGFEGGFNKIGTYKYTNKYDYTHNTYTIYRSTNTNLGNTTVKVFQ